MYTLYGKKGSGSASVQAALEIIGAPYRIVETASWDVNDGLRRAARGKSAGTDSHARAARRQRALRKRGDPHPSRRRASRGPAAAAARSARAQAVRGLVFIAANCYAAISIIDFPERWCADADADEPVKERIRAGSRARLHRHWEMFADLFPARPWLSGNDIGSLDLYAAVVSKWSGARKHLEAERPALLRDAAAHRSAPEGRAGVRAALASRLTRSEASSLNAAL